MTCNDTFPEGCDTKGCENFKYRPRYDLMTDEDFEFYMDYLDKGRAYTDASGKTRYAETMPEDKKLISKWKEDATRAFYYHKYNKNND